MKRALVVGTAALVFAGAAFPAEPKNAPLPVQSSLAVDASDFDAGARVTDTTIPVAGQNVFMRILAPARLHGRPLVGVALVVMEGSAQSASDDFTQFRTEVALRSGKAQFAKVWAGQLVEGLARGSGGKTKVTVTHTTVGQRVLMGDSAFRLPIVFKTTTGLFRVSVGVAQIDRALDVVELIAASGHVLTVGDIKGEVTSTLRHLRAGFTVANTSPPTISGTPQQGRTLTVDEGAWSGAPSAYTYAWSRCDAAGGSCTPISGAIAKTYVPSSADSGATLRVTVTGANSVSSKDASSPPTVAVA